jgi:streptomycin 6-kinase
VATGDAGDAADDDVVIPQSFVDMPRWWTEGKQWLADLPRLIRSQCATWDVCIDGQVVHGSNAIVVPVVRGTESFALRMTPPDPQVVEEIRALQFWDGRGTVELVEADPAHGAMLLELLAAHDSLADRPVAEAMVELGRMMRRLAVPAPADVMSTAGLARKRSAELETEWRKLNEPFDMAVLTEALRLSGELSATAFDFAVNGDLHSEQVLRGVRERWLTVDPVLLRGDIEYDLARILWTRIDEMPSSAAIVGHFDTVIREADVDRGRARDWVVFRAVDYWLWGLNAGLTEDPQRCERLVRAFLA